MSILLRPKQIKSQIEYLYIKVRDICVFVDGSIPLLWANDRGILLQMFLFGFPEGNDCYVRWQHSNGKCECLTFYQKWTQRTCTSRFEKIILRKIQFRDYSETTRFFLVPCLPGDYSNRPARARARRDNILPSVAARIAASTTNLPTNLPTILPTYQLPTNLPSAVPLRAEITS